MKKPKEKAIGARPKIKAEGQTESPAGQELRKMVQYVDTAGSAEREPKVKEEEDRIIAFTLRMAMSLDLEIKGYLKTLPLRRKLDRQEFIVAAIEEKLRRDQKKTNK